MASSSSLPILLCSDFPIFRESLQAHFDRDGDFELVACENDQTEVLALVASLQPRVVLLDLNIPSEMICNLLDGIHAVSLTRILVMADSVDNSGAVEALRHGAHGVVLRRTTPALLMKSIQTVLLGDYWVSRKIMSDLMLLVTNGTATSRERKVTDAMTASATASSGGDAVLFGLTHRELQIITTLVDGQTNKDIAVTLGISQHTVKHHLTNIFDKLGVYNRVELVLYAINGKLCPSPPEG